MAIKVTITFQGLDEAITHFSQISGKAQENLQKQTEALAQGTLQAWKEATPIRTGQLRGADATEVDGLSFTLLNATKYYDFVDRGHQTPAGWHTRRGYRPAKRRSHVAGREITTKAVQFIEDNIEEYLSKFLDGV